jgi:hypothetical protein
MSQDNAGDKPSGGTDYPQITTYLKYCSDSDDVIKAIFEKHEIRFTQPAALNDPLEFNPIIRFHHDGINHTRFVFDGIVFPSEEQRLRFHIIESHLNRFGVLSLTKVGDSFDMWSRYANGHRGFLIEFKDDFNGHPCMRSKDGREYAVREVRYVDEYAINVDELVDEHGQFLLEAVNEQMFFTKTSRWADEEEWRLVRPLADCSTWTPLTDKAHRDRRVHSFEFSLNCVQSVTFGACMAGSDRRRIMEACRGTSIAFQQACIARDRKDRWGRPGEVGIDTPKDWSSALGWDLGMVGELAYVRKHAEPPVEIKSLKELPYARDKKFIDILYEKGKVRRS